MDFSYVISMNVYFDCLSKEQDTMLFKTGNVHKCTEHGKTQSVAFIDRKPGTSTLKQKHGNKRSYKLLKSKRTRALKLING